ncbi:MULTISPECIES: hypothetical protein [unclassified Bartonella]|uniref:hypothetical protein n=1 Tax=unclassified Bartonella TaxID=2645622 RepID=UPI0035D0A31C
MSSSCCLSDEGGGLRISVDVTFETGRQSHFGKCKAVKVKINPQFVISSSFSFAAFKSI